MENLTTSSATVPDGIRIGVCGLVGALYLSASIVTVIFNGLLLYVIFKDPLKCFRRPFAVYMTGLAMTDFLFGAVLNPLSARIEFYCVKDKDGETTFYHIIDYFIDNSATVLIFAVSVDRLLAVAFPIFYRVSVKNTHAAIVIVCAWFYCMAFSLIQLADVPVEIYDTVDVHMFVTFALTADGIIYLFIYLILRKRRKVFPGRDETSQKDEEQIRRVNSEKEFAFTAFLILLALVLTQIPYLVMTVIEANCQSCTETTWFFVCHEFADFLLCLSAIANPYLYGWRVKQSRDSLMAVFCRSRLEPADLEISQNTSETRNQR